MDGAKEFRLQIWDNQYQDGAILEAAFQPKTNRKPPSLSVDGDSPEASPTPAQLHAIHAASRAAYGWPPPAGSVSYSAAEISAAGGTLVYAPEPHNPFHYNVEFRDLTGLSGNAMKRARRAIKERLKRVNLDWTP